MRSKNPTVYLFYNMLTSGKKFNKDIFIHNLDGSLLISAGIAQKLLIVILRSRKHTVVCTQYSLTGMILSALQAYANHVYANCSITAERILTGQHATHSLMLSRLYHFLQYHLVGDTSGLKGALPS